MPPRRLIRRRPLWDRIKARFDPWDYALWLSEEIETRNFGSRSLGNQVGVACNFVFILARVYGSYSAGSDTDDIFNDDETSTSSGWLAWFARSITWELIILSSWNMYYAFSRTRAYRFFEADVEQPLNTSSAHRVRVQSSPSRPSPLQMLADLTDLAGETAESRAHPDRTRDVWELRMWDPVPACLQLVCLFSPLHVLIYMMTLPLAPLDPRPSVTVFKCLLQQVAMSGLLLAMEASFSQQSKDSTLVKGQVLKEYDNKYVHPRLNPPVVRDVGTQVGEDEDGNEWEDIQVGTPATLVRRRFQTHPNQNYAKHFDPDGSGYAPSGGSPNPAVYTPVRRAQTPSQYESLYKARPSPLRQSMAASRTPRVSPEKPATQDSGTSTGTTYTGSLGVYSHADSPLKKAASFADIRGGGNPFASPRNSRELAAIEQKEQAERMIRRSSPVKEHRLSGLASSMQLDGQLGDEPQSSPNPFANMGRHRGPYERFPSRR
ncbi:hypothetical protein DHEL01_v203048 [Diaporthe helianthi]|uniref:Meiotically up-regulated gene 154 protein n=1 Tax=Diaporthe helianthi TaxID=158607 RepID=A0A2P5I7S9_DIAHE|nr:hypothetical protein DHEL01_v203048 [Diaporthe helianthi]